MALEFALNRFYWPYLGRCQKGCDWLFPF